MLLLVSSLKLLAEIVLLCLIGQWLLGLLAGSKRDTNFFYRVLFTVTQPVVRGVRLISPRSVLDRHIALATFVLLAMFWVVVTIAKIDICLNLGVEACR
jgi:hypothetical protein